MTERLHFHFSLSYIGEGNGNPLQCSCLENPRDGGAWWAAAHGVAQSRTWLKQLSISSRTIFIWCQSWRCNTECLKNYGCYQLWLVTLYTDGDQNHPRGKKNARRQTGCLRRFTNSWKRRKEKGKWERTRYAQLNAEFQRIARRNKIASLSEQWKK